MIQRVPLDWLARQGLTIQDTPGVRAHLLKQYGHWSPLMRRLISDNDGVYVGAAGMIEVDDPDEPGFRDPSERR